MKKTTFRAGVERLEARETPSAVTAMAAHHVYAVKGSGSGLVTSYATTATGFTLTGTASGTDKKFGSFSTESATAEITTKGKATGQVVLADALGDTVDLSLKGTVNFVKHSSTILKGVFTFKVTGGTGLFAGVTGSGTTSGTASITTFSFVFTYSGKVRV